MSLEEWMCLRRIGECLRLGVSEEEDWEMF